MMNSKVQSRETFAQHSAQKNTLRSWGLMSFLKAINSYTDAYVMPALEDSWNKFNPPPQNKLKN